MMSNFTHSFHARDDHEKNYRLILFIVLLSVIR